MRSSLVSARRNPAGFLEARARRGSGSHGSLLAAFLESDVQGDATTARALLAAVAAVRRGQASQPEALGNAFAIHIAADGAVLRNAILAGAAAEHYPLDEFGAALETWIAAIERARRGAD
jgi:hypothetical protein